MDRLKSLVVSLLNRATLRYLRRGDVTVIAVAGSIGKTSTVQAVRTVLGQRYQVHQPATAYNTTRSVHLEVFDQKFATSLPGWLWVTAKMLLRSLGRPSFEVLVVELGTDHPGEMATFAWLRPRIGVLTAIAPEHMEHFRTIEAVAREELVLADYCDELVFNRHTVDTSYVPDGTSGKVIWYGAGTEYRAGHYRLEGSRASADFRLGPWHYTDVPLHVVGKHSLQALLAAAAVARLCGLDETEIRAGLSAVEPVRGRMQLLTGAQDSLIIDDSYNASPEAVKASLDVLYGLAAAKRIAILGAMNEMGGYSPQAHREVGAYCDPAKLDLVVTIGQEANDYLAPAAVKGGCRVKCFLSPYEAGEFVRRQLAPRSAVLVKGSQNRVFAEEAIKPLLADPADCRRLVRQSEFWMRRKHAQFDAAPRAEGVAD